jgi:hypothetical protein
VRTKYNPERCVGKGISHKKGTSGNNGTRIRSLREKSFSKSDRRARESRRFRISASWHLGSERWWSIKRGGWVLKIQEASRMRWATMQEVANYLRSGGIIVTVTEVGNG